MTGFAYLDLDGTLVRANLAHVAVHHQARRPTLTGRLGALGALAASGPALLALDQLSRSTFQEALYLGFRGLSEDRLRWLGEHAAREVYLPALRPGARRLLERLRSTGLKPVLVTGSLAHVAGPLARLLHIDEVASNRLEVRDGHATGKLVHPVMSGAQKAAWIRAHAARHGASLDACHAYTDSASDLPMLAVVGHPCAVNPDRALLLEARALKWPVLDLDADDPAVTGAA